MSPRGGRAPRRGVRRGSGTGRPPRVAVVLAAGKGKRMRSARPKVLHEVAGRPMLAWVLDAARRVGCARILVVVGHGAGEVREAFPEPDLTWVLQEEQLGTGHALAQAVRRVRGRALLLVLSGDVPLVTPRTLEALLARAERGWGAMAVARLTEPGSLGRVIAGPRRALDRIVEAVDASPEELAIELVNAGLYALPAPEIGRHLASLSRDNAKGEYYLTDAVGAAAAAGRRIALLELRDPAEALGINDRAELARAHRALLDRSIARLAARGVTVLEPGRTVIEPGVEVGRDTVIHPGVALVGRTSLGPSCVVHQGAWVRDSTLGRGAVIEPYSVLDRVEIGSGCRVGPFARLRPGTVLLVGSDTMLVAPVRVGEGAVTAAGSVITKEVPPGALGVARDRQRNVAGWAERAGRTGRTERAQPARARRDQGGRKKRG